MLRLLSVGDPEEEHFQNVCDHSREESCIDCTNLQDCFKEVLQLVPSNKEDSLYEVKTGIEEIYEWQCHIIRRAQEEEEKRVILQKISSSTAYWLQDWSMKFIPLFYGESMQEWHGKTGISNHIDCLFFPDPDDTSKLKKGTYYSFIERSNQDGAAVFCVNHHILQ